MDLLLFLLLTNSPAEPKSPISYWVVLEMDNGDIESGEEEFHGQRGRKYRPVEAHDRAVLEMSSMDPGSSSSSSSIPPLRQPSLK